MPLPASGPLTLTDIQTEWSGTNPISLNEYYAGGSVVYAGATGTLGLIPSSGAISISNFYGTQASTDGLTWTYRENLNPLVWGTNEITTHNPVVGLSKFNLASGILATSTDGSNWTNSTALWQATTRVNFAGSGIYGDRFVRFVSNLDDNSSTVGTATATSPDGITWTYSTQIATIHPGVIPGATSYRIAWNGSVYCAVAGQGLCATSTDGLTWTNQLGLNAANSWATNTVTDITWTGSQFVCVGNLGRVATSPNGVTWTYRATLAATTWSTRTVNKVTFNGSVVCVSGQLNFIATSADHGATWTFQAGLRSVTTSGFAYSVDSAGSRLIVSNDYVASTIVSNIFTSDDNGVTWAARPQLATTGWGVSRRVNRTLYSGSILAAFGEGGRVATSTDLGNTWTNQTGLNTNISLWGGVSISDVAFGNSVYCAIGSLNVDVVRCSTSPDGITWTYRAGLATAIGTTSAILCIVWTGTIFVVGGTNGRIATSPDGVTWTNRTGLSSSAFGAITVNTMVWTGTQLCVGGANGRIATSLDGITWTNQTGLSSSAWGTGAGDGFAVTEVKWNGSSFLAAGGNGKAATSPDGVTWTYQTGLSLTTWGTSVCSSMVWTGAVWLLGTGSGWLATSPDGVTWTYQTGLINLTNWNRTTPNAPAEVRALIRTPRGYILAGGAYGRLAKSTDNGATWTLITPLMTNPLWTQNIQGSVNAFATNGPNLLVVGLEGRAATTP